MTSIPRAEAGATRAAPRFPNASPVVAQFRHLLEPESWQALCDQAPDIADAIAAEIFGAIEADLGRKVLS